MYHKVFTKYPSYLGFLKILHIRNGSPAEGDFKFGFIQGRYSCSFNRYVVEITIRLLSSCGSRENEGDLCDY